MKEAIVSESNFALLNFMIWKVSTLLLAALSAAMPASAQHSSSEPVLDVSAMDRTIDPCVDF